MRSIVNIQKTKKMQSKSSVITADPERSIYLCSFTRELEEGFVKKYMGLAGHIESVYIGIYKHRKGNK